MLTMIMKDGALYQRMTFGTAEKVDRGMRLTGEVIALNQFDEGLYVYDHVEVEETPCHDVKLLNNFAKAIGYDSGADFYTTLRMLCHREYLTKVELVRVRYKNILDVIEIRVCGPKHNLFFDDIYLIKLLYDCRLSYNPKYFLTRIFVEVENGTKILSGDSRLSTRTARR